MAHDPIAPNVDIRHVSLEDEELFFQLGVYAFDPERAPEQPRRWVLGRDYPLEWTLGAYVEGELAARLVIIPFRMYLNGAWLSLGGLAGVACAPEHRRTGLVGRLLRESLVQMREGGQTISMLYPSFAALYRGHGWAPCLPVHNLSFTAAEVRLDPPVAPVGRVRRVGPEQWAVLDELHRAAARNGWLERDERRWCTFILQDWRGRPHDVGVWYDAQDRPQGYVIYHRTPNHEPGAGFAQRIEVHDLVARSDEAYRQLARFLLTHDWGHPVEWSVPPDDPFTHMVADHRTVQIKAALRMMLRVVDVPAALAGRPWHGPDDAPLGLVLRVLDAHAPWNDGRWRIEREPGGPTVVTPTDRAADVTLPITTLGALYAGHLAPHAARRAGLLAAESDAVLDALGRLFSMEESLFSSDWY